MRDSQPFVSAYFEGYNAILLKYRVAFFLAVMTLSAEAQMQLDSIRVSIPARVPLADVLHSVEQRYPLKFFFKENWLEGYTAGTDLDGKSLKDVLDLTLAGSDISYGVYYNYAVILRRDPAREIARATLLQDAQLRQKNIGSVLIGDKRFFTPGNQILIHGIVREERTGHRLSGVEVNVDDQVRVLTDSTGRFRILIAQGDHVVIFGLHTYDDKLIALSAYASGEVNITLQTLPVILDEVIVSDQQAVNRQVGQTSLSVSALKRMPSLLGQADIIKQIQNQPGVTTVGEVASGFNVRGGSVDQNLVLFDGVSILNTSHAFGFFPAFNADVVGNVSFFRGGIPAEYGGRVSSVLDITGKEADDRWRASGGIGMISTHLAGGGPVNNGRTKIMASGRVSYSDWMLNVIRSAYSGLSNSAVSFYDASLKVSHQLNNRSSLTFSGYVSADRFSLINDTLYHAQSVAAALRYHTRLGDRADFSAVLDVGQYKYRVDEKYPSTAASLGYSITYPSLRIDFHIDGAHRLSIGWHNTLHRFDPGYLRPTSAESNSATVQIPEQQALESAIYISDGFNLSEKLLLDGGVRFSMFNQFGPGTQYLYAPGMPLSVQNKTDSVNYSRGDEMKTYGGIEPRLSLRYLIGDHTSLKFGFNRIYQYLHLVTNTAAVAPVDVWQSSSAYFKPQVGDQLSLGYFMTSGKGVFEAFAEGFYKRVKNVLDYKDGAALILNPHPETAFIPGNAYSYGVELSVARVAGRLTGALSYTWSRSFRKTSSEFPNENINGGDRYPSNYDQPHVVQLNWRYGLSRRWFFTGTFVYHTGRPMSVPVSAYQVDHVSVMEFTDRNSHRLPAYHRLDVAFVLEGNHKRGKFWDGTWTLSAYNAYGRKNAYAVFYQDNGTGVLQPYKLSVVGTIIPSLSYGFKI